MLAVFEIANTEKALVDATLVDQPPFAKCKLETFFTTVGETPELERPSRATTYARRWTTGNLPCLATSVAFS